MNRKIGMAGSAVNFVSVIGFAVSMPFFFSFGNYLFSMLIAFSFVMMMCGFAFYAGERRKLAGYTSLAFAAVYADNILLVYFAQLTTVRMDELTPQATELLDFQKMGLMFSYDLLGYAVMALSGFFAGLTIVPASRADKWLKVLLMIHGVFFVSCLILPMLGIFQADTSPWIGVAVLEFWCLYFCPVGILSTLHFMKQRSEK